MIGKIAANLQFFSCIFLVYTLRGRLLFREARIYSISLAFGNKVGVYHSVFNLYCFTVIILRRRGGSRTRSELKEHGQAKAAGSGVAVAVVAAVAAAGDRQARASLSC